MLALSLIKQGVRKTRKLTEKTSRSQKEEQQEERQEERQEELRSKIGQHQVSLRRSILQGTRLVLEQTSHDLLSVLASQVTNP